MKFKEWLGAENKLGIDIVSKKYPSDEFEDFADRVSGGNPVLRQMIVDQTFIPAGRILANRGLQKLGKKVTYSNCYVLPAPKDCIESIFDTAKEAARTYSYGGGVGIDVTTLRPNGCSVTNTAEKTSGAVSFMDFYSYVTGLIGQNGRRGALMLSMSCSHPDIEEFIDCKTDLEKVTKANISVRVTDEFMECVASDKTYMTTFELEDGTVFTKEIDARKVFKKLVDNNYDYAEPGILFWDGIEQYNLLSNYSDFKYAGTNPCAEEPLPEYGSCLLGSINLSKFVTNKFTEFAEFDSIELKRTVKQAVTALNEILDEGINLHPLEQQRAVARDWRQIGLGIMGLADCLIMLGIKYGSPDAVKFCDDVGFLMADTAIRQSARLAKEYGSFPKYESMHTITSEFFIENTTEKTKKLVMEYGLRNSQLLTIAPTGTISTMLGISGGIEPVFSFGEYNRKTESLHGKDVNYTLVPAIQKAYTDYTGNDTLPDYFVSAHDIKPADRIAMQSAWQKHIDASISSTINLKKEASKKDVYDVYMSAWMAGLKGVTVFRDGCKRGGILTTGTETTATAQYNHITPVSRKDIGTTHGSTYCKKCACGTLYITINQDDDGNVVESFINTGKGGVCQASSNGTNRMVSLALRSGVKVDEIADQLIGIRCGACEKAKSVGKHVDGISCPDILGKTLRDFCKAKGSIPVKTAVVNPCPECGAELEMSGGCVICKECGYSKCD